MNARDQKEIKREIRLKKKAIDETYLEINRFKIEIISINNNVQYLKDVNNSISNEILNRKKINDLLRNQYEDIFENQIEMKNNTSFFTQMKIKMIRKKMHELVTETFQFKPA